MNYLGWLLCAYSFFQVFALYISKASHASSIKHKSNIENSHWYQVIFVYVTLSLPVMILPFTGTDSVVKDPVGVE